MKKEVKILLALIILMANFLIYYFTYFTNKISFLDPIIIIISLSALAGYLLGSLKLGKAIPISNLNKDEKIIILRHYFPADYKLGQGKNKSYYLIKRIKNNKLYFFIGPENYNHLPFKNFEFKWDGKKLIPYKKI